MPQFSETYQPTSEQKRKGWTFKHTIQRVLAGNELGTNDKVPLYERVVRAHVRRAAVDGDMPAIKELYDRIDGKLTDKTEHTGKDGAPLIPDDMEAARRIAFLLTRKAR